ncbi:hypothetical protein ACMD2_23879 [Ananas comosus]|uniref:Uncharacterized protein n=1 Tax=Ananas comosus TaxID=4615 RepID=A0A199VGI9_ANACO|nr:hypothetical protein ACMD2_23879 [Ananas comosus]
MEWGDILIYEDDGAEGILSRTCTASFIPGRFCGAEQQHANPSLKQLSTASSFPSTSPRIAGSAILSILFRSSTTNPAFHWHNSTSENTRPAISSNSTIPKAYTSHFALGFRFFSDSGAWYGGGAAAAEDEPQGLTPAKGERSGRLLVECIDRLLPNNRADAPGPPSPETSRSSPKSPISGSSSALNRMLLGFTLPCTHFFSWRYASPLATPLAILNRASQFKWNADEPSFPESRETMNHFYPVSEKSFSYYSCSLELFSG